jgi:hypothetical protein
LELATVAMFIIGTAPDLGFVRFIICSRVLVELADP